jgi:ribosomal-protein-alanine N-acetyltransferase
MKYIPRPLAQTTDDTLKLIRLMNENISKNDSVNWGIVPKDRAAVMGSIGYVRMSKEDYRAEVGYMLHRDLHGKGYIREALEAVLDYGFNHMKLHSVSAVIDPENIASERVLQRHGFVKEAHFKEDFFHNGRFLDSVHYGMLASVYAARQL